MAAGVVGLELEGPAQGGLVAGGNERVGLAGRRRQALHELRHLGLGQRTDEPVDHLAVPQREDGGDRLHLEGLGEPRVLVHVDLGQLDGSAGGGHGLLEDGPEGGARPAPWGPQVDDHGHLGAALQDSAWNVWSVTSIGHDANGWARPDGTGTARDQGRWSAARPAPGASPWARRLKGPHGTD